MLGGNAVNPRIRLIGRYGDYRIGEILSPPASLRKMLFDLKLAVLESETIETSRPVISKGKKRWMKRKGGI